jgi:hypothetical protein
VHDTDALIDLLAPHADDRKAAWWANYVKGARFLGVPMADTRKVALGWWAGRGGDPDPIRTCLELGRHPLSDVKLAGVAIMEHVLIPGGELLPRDLPRIRDALDAGAYDDWNACDWMCVKVVGRLLAPTVAGSPSGIHEEITRIHGDVLEWSTSEALWTRRASLVGFVNLLQHSEPSPGFDEAFLATAGVLLADDRRFVQTGVGWTMRMFGLRCPLEAAAFLEAHIGSISREALANAARGLPDERRSALLDLHRSR